MDSDVWMKEETRKLERKHYVYVLLYCNGVIVISNNAEGVLMEEIGKHWKLKEGSVGPPKIYLGAPSIFVVILLMVRRHRLLVWHSMSRQQSRMLVKKKLLHGYQLEIDMSEELDHDKASYFQSLIGVLRWMVELGQVDICVEVSIMSAQLALPRQDYLQ